LLPLPLRVLPATRLPAHPPIARSTARPNTQKKKPKDEKEDEEKDEGEEAGEEDESDSANEAGDAGGDDDDDGFVSIPAGREYKYEELLDRMYSLLLANNPELAGDRKRFLMKPPQVVREGSKRVVIINFGDICKTLNRSQVRAASAQGLASPVSQARACISPGAFGWAHFRIVPPGLASPGADSGTHPIGPRLRLHACGDGHHWLNRRVEPDGDQGPLPAKGD
jgi:hypothetical protein